MFYFIDEKITGGDFFMATISIQFVAKLLASIITMISPEIKEYLKKIILELEEKAKATANPFDDLLVELVKMILL